MNAPASFKELQKDLLTEIAKEAVKLGFKLNKSSHSFRRKTPFGWQSFGISPIVHPGVDFDITANVSIGFDALTELLNMYDPSRDEEQRKNNKFKFGAELGNLIDGRTKRFTVATSADIVPVANAVVNTFVTYGLPYFERYSSLETVLNDIEGDDESWDAWLLMPFRDERAKLAIGIAFLLNQHDRFLRIANAKEAYLITKNTPQIQLESFRRFRDELKRQFKH